MLCSLKYGIYIFFGAWQFIAIFFTYFLVPETRGVPIEEVRIRTPLPLTLITSFLYSPQNPILQQCACVPERGTESSVCFAQ